MFIASPFSPSSHTRLGAFLVHHIDRTWCPHHHRSIKLGSKCITGGSPSRAFSQIFEMKQRTVLFLITCLLFQSLEITGEPQEARGSRGNALNKGPFAYSQSPSQPHAEYLRQSVMISGRSETIDDHGVSMVDSDDITIFQHLTTITPLLIGNPLFHGNKSNEFPSENTASVIASSFRNIDNAQTQSSSSEDETTGTSQNRQTQSQKRKSHRKKCDQNKLKGCLDGLPPMNFSGIPSTAKAVNTACSFYDKGISCFDSWAKNCLQDESKRQQIKASIIGAHEMFSFLCKDPKFRADYLKHKDCYRQLSPHYDDCSRHFIEGLRRNTGHNKTAFCCIRLDFLKCISKYSSFFCSLDATKFMIKMAETLIRSSIRTKSRIPDYCVNIQPQHCVTITDKGVMSSPIKFFSLYFPAFVFSSIGLTLLMKIR